MDNNTTANSQENPSSTPVNPLRTQATTPLPHIQGTPVQVHPPTQATSPMPQVNPSVPQATTPLPHMRNAQMQNPQMQSPQRQATSYSTHTYTRPTPYTPQAQPYPQRPSSPYSPVQPAAQPQNYPYPHTSYGYGYPYQQWQAPSTPGAPGTPGVPGAPSVPQQKSTWSTTILAVVAAVALLLGGFIGAGIISALNDDSSQSAPNNWDAEPDYGNGVFGEDGTDPFFPENTGDSSGTRVESAPGVLIIDSLLTGGIGSGSGMVISPDGYAVTNYHVVEGSTTVRVTIADTEETYNATVIGHDATVDIALIKLEGAKDLDYVQFDTSNPKKGTDVTVIGNADGQGFLSKLEGTITAVNQDITAMTDGEGSEELTNLIQTDADVVQGYSGGPMFNKDGKVIGVIVAASSAGILSGDTDGYAIPAEDAMKVVEQIKSGKSKGSTIVGANAALGVTVTSESLNGSSSGKGASVVQVARGSAAEEAGIQAGDVITSINGKSVNSASDLSKLIKTFSIGEKVKVTYTDSSGNEKTVEVTLGESPVN